MALHPSTIRTRLLSSAMAIVFISVVTGLYFANNALTRSEGVRARLDAFESATRVEGFIAVRIEALSAFEGLYLDSLRVSQANDLGQLPPGLNARLTYFDRLWLADSAGVVRFSRARASRSSAPLLQADLDTVRAFRVGDALKRARTNMRAAVSSTDVLAGDSIPSFLIIEPFFLGRAPLGFAIGEVRLAELRQALLTTYPPSRVRLALRAGADTVLAVDSSQYMTVVRPDSSTVQLRTVTNWTVDVTHTRPERLIRLTLFAVAAGALTALLAGLIYERRQAQRIAERSAELEHLSAELLRANRAKSEFLANVSHELRTPLNAIVGFVDLLRDGVYGELNPRQIGPVERIEASANHLRHLVDQILDLAKMAAGRLEVHREPVDLRPFVFDVASEVESLVTEKGLTFSLAVGATLPRIRTDPTHLRQILVNLLGNAVKFTSAGTIAVRARLLDANGKSGRPDGADALRALRARAPRADGTWVVLQVADTGIGIPEKDRDRIFDEFEQVNAGPRGDSMRRGTGLGLSISRRLARLLGGDITVESEVGKGSVFSVWLPVDPADLRRATPTMPTAAIE
jgi:signal transduction histidine kinase